MEKFCKLFETETHGQLLAMLGRNDQDKPEVRVFAAPEGLGVCSLAASYSDDDEGWDRAEEWFSRIDEDKAIEHTKILFDSAAEMTEETNA